MDGDGIYDDAMERALPVPARGRMTARSSGHGRRRGTRSARKRRWRVPKVWPRAATRRRWWRSFRRMPVPMQWAVSVVAIGALAICVNFLYQVVRKPTELFFPVSGTLYKAPAETWDEYAPIFRRHSTAVMTPEFLAALAQVEGSGNPIVRTYWRWSWKPEPFEMYRPASSAVGMYQITDGTFEEAKRFCVHDHVVVEDGPWNDWDSCWFNGLYFRVVPSHAVEMTAAYLDRGVALALKRHGIRSATLRQKQNLATLMHLCGMGAGNVYAKRRLHLAPGQRCGDHSAAGYLAKVESMKRVFVSLSASEE
jgi:hypothetical protein